MLKRIVLTGGPSAGKTTLLNLIHRRYAGRVTIAPEAATIHFRQGALRPETFEERVLTQKNIFQLQRWLESEAHVDRPELPLFCDRGSLDGCAYWPGTVKEFCFAMGTSIERELKRYTAVLHLQSAAIGEGYVNSTIRVESREEAAALDKRIAETWAMHPNYIFVPNQGNFAQKLDAALAELSAHLPQKPSMLATVSDLIALS